MSISPVQHSSTMTTETVARRTEQQKAIELYFDVLLPAAMAECRAYDQQSNSLPLTHPNRFSRSISAIRARTRTGTPSLLAGLRSPSKSDNTRSEETFPPITHHVCTIAMLVVVEEEATNSLLPPTTDTNNNVSVVTGPPTPWFSNNPAWTSTASATTRRPATDQPMLSPQISATLPSTSDRPISLAGKDRTSIEEAIRNLKLHTAELEAQLAEQLMQSNQSPAETHTAEPEAQLVEQPMQSNQSPAETQEIQSSEPTNQNATKSRDCTESDRTHKDLIFSEVALLSPSRPTYRPPLPNSTPEADSIITAHRRRLMYAELTEAVKKGTAITDEQRRLMHVALKAAAKARIKKQIVDDIHNKYELYMRAQKYEKKSRP